MQDVILGISGDINMNKIGLSLKLEFKWEISFQSDKGELLMNAKNLRCATED